jgi:predicted permease
MTEIFRRLRYLLNRRRYDQELASDMELHREMAASAGNAHFGSTLRLREEARDAWGWTWIDRFSQDVRYAARMLRKSPGFTAVAVLMLALGIGVNVAAFGFFNLMVLRPLPVRDPGTLLRFGRQAPQGFADNFPYPEVAFFREHSKKLSAILALNISRLSADGEEKPLRADFVTANFFSELGGKARLGRMLDPARDEAADAEPVVALSYGFWQSHFGGDPSVIGKTIRLNGRPATVIGVASNEFSGLNNVPELWLPIVQQSYFFKESHVQNFSDSGISVLMWGRLQPGVPPRVAEEELKSLAAELHKQHPKDIWEKESLPSQPGGYAMTVRGDMYPLLALIGALCLLILAVSCVTLGSLLLAQGMAREREIAIRAAVGAGRARLIRQLFTESLLLAFLGSVAGLALGYLALRSLMVWTESPAWLNPTPDWRVLAFAMGMGFGAAILFGLTPAWQAARQRYRTAITRQFLIEAQVAASCVLLIVAGLLVRALNHATSTRPGFDYEQVISMDPSFHGYSPAQARMYFDALRSRLSRVPGVESVSLVSNPPLGNRWSVEKTKVAGRTVDVHFNNIDPEFFQTMKIPIVRGRNLMRGDTHAIVVSESLARLQWPAADPLGKQFQRGVDSAGVSVSDTVVGVSGNARLVSPEDSDAVEVYQLAETDLLPSMVVLVRTSRPPKALVPFVTSVSRSIDPKLFPEVQLMKISFQQKIREAGYAAVAVSLLGLLSLFIACLGIIGLVAYAVSKRTKEIGIRMALGAKPSHVLSTVLRQFSLPVIAGLIAGVGGAAALSQLLRQVLYGISNLDPIAYLGAIGIFAAAVALAALLPARRALRVDPLRALRYE